MISFQKNKKNGAVYTLLVCFGLMLNCTNSQEASECHSACDLLQYLRLDEVRQPTPVVPGSSLHIRGESFISKPEILSLQVSISGITQETKEELTLALEAEILSANEIIAFIPKIVRPELNASDGFVGRLEVRFTEIEGKRVFSASLPITFEWSNALRPQLERLEEDIVYLNDPLPIVGRGFLNGQGEGITQISLVGHYTTKNGGLINVSEIVLDATPFIDTFDRTRIACTWSPLIGGIEPGVFRGTFKATNVMSNGEVFEGGSLEVEIWQQETVIFNVSPDVVSLGQIVHIHGRGFIGSPFSADEQPGLTIFQLKGEFTPCSGIPLNCLHMFIDIDRQLIGNWVSGNRIDFELTVSNSGGLLHSVDFGTKRGLFNGSITPILILGHDRYEGITTQDITLELGPVRQIGWVRFIPGFSDSLDLFGLGAVQKEIQKRVIDRMQEIYCPSRDSSECINVEFRAEEPQDFYPGAYSIIDIGGPDPNNLGLFGYDNTPGKDTENLRLWDHVGGENAMGALDGYGYGGVFVESMLYWSSHPPFSYRPAGAPPAHHRFDEIFDPVRNCEVVAGEYPHGEDPDRTADIEAAISFLSNMIADTAAHEFGHSLGLAQPYIPHGAYHNAIPQNGCLMDSGRERPLEERARIDGNKGSHFCLDNLEYLQAILPME